MVLPSGGLLAAETGTASDPETMLKSAILLAVPARRPHEERADAGDARREHDHDGDADSGVHVVILPPVTAAETSGR